MKTQTRPLPDSLAQMLAVNLYQMADPFRFSLLDGVLASLLDSLTVVAAIPEDRRVFNSEPLLFAVKTDAGVAIFTVRPSGLTMLLEGSPDVSALLESRVQFHMKQVTDDVFLCDALTRGALRGEPCVSVPESVWVPAQPARVLPLEEFYAVIDRVFPGEVEIQRMGARLAQGQCEMMGLVI